MNLPPGWYGYCSVKDLSRNRVTRLERFGSHWAVWWNSKKQSWVIQADRCPHRSASLSGGRIVDDGTQNCIECPFHGFRFSDSGQCTQVPEIGRDAPGLKLATLQVIVRQGMLWVRWGQPQTEGPSWFEDLEGDAYTYAESRHLWTASFTRAVESQLDYAHLPFVHHNSIGRGFDPSVAVEWDLRPELLRVHLGKAGPNTGFFEFVFPNFWRLKVSSKITQTLVFAPVNESSTMIYARSYHCFTRIPILRSWIAWISAKGVNPVILGQDQRVVEGQYGNDVTHTVAAERLFPSDRAIGAFRNWINSSPV